MSTQIVVIFRGLTKFDFTFEGGFSIGIWLDENIITNRFHDRKKKHVERLYNLVEASSLRVDRSIGIYKAAFFAS
jgi:hypothetical protein